MNFNTLLSRTTTIALNNTSGSAASWGDVGIIDTASAESWRHETSGSSPSRMNVGVAMNRGGIAISGRGLYAMGGYLPRVNLTNTAAIGDYIRLSTTRGKGVSSPTAAAGDFAQALSSGSTPTAIHFGFPMRA